MASGSILILVRKEPVGSVKRNLLRAVLGTKDKLPDMPHYVQLCEFQYADTRLRRKLNVLFKAHFISNMNVLGRHFDLNPLAQNPDDYFYAITYSLLKRMWQATHYLVNMDYSRKTLELLDSEFIPVLAQLSADYMAWKSGSDLCFQDLVDKNTLIRLDRVLQACLTIINLDDSPDNIQLLYRVW